MTDSTPSESDTSPLALRCWQTGKAVVVGERSFGKGSVQTLFRLNEGEALRWLGQHPERQRALDVPDHRRWVAEGMGHLDLVRRPEVASRLLEWLAPNRV